MATKSTKTSTSKASTAKTAVEVSAKSVEDINITANEVKATDPMAQLMAMMESMNSQLGSLTQELASTKAELATTKIELAEAKERKVVTCDLKEEDIPVVTTGYIAPAIESFTGVTPQYNVYQNPGVPSLAEKYIEAMATRKSDKEVTIVHNREILGGAKTCIKLDNVTIEFSKLGETRTLSWHQFEQLVSKYRGFFNRQIILVADKDRSVAEEYVLPCVQRPDGIALTRNDLDKLPYMDINQLSNLYNSLTSKDKEFMLSYWLGQCYTRTPGYYERYKIEALNTLSGNGMFDALLAFMNGKPLTLVDSKTKGRTRIIRVVLL